MFDKAGTETKKSNFKKVDFLSLPPGMHRVRLIPDEHRVQVHYIPEIGSVKCLEDDCPMCKNNRQIYLEHPNDYFKVKGYYSRSTRYHINVLDRTSVKVCPSCGHESKKDASGMFPPACTECMAIIATVSETISNKIKVANISETNAIQLKAFDSSTLDETGEKLGLANFDIIFNVTISGNGKKAVTVFPDASARGPIEYNPDDLFDLTRAYLTLTADEIVSVFSGVRIKDIFLARTPKKDVDAEIDTAVTEIQTQLNELFE